MDFELRINQRIEVPVYCTPMTTMTAGNVMLRRRRWKSGLSGNEFVVADENAALLLPTEVDGGAFLFFFEPLTGAAGWGLPWGSPTATRDCVLMSISRG